MTEAEWLATSNPQPMLEFLGDAASNRKLFLGAIACGRHVVQWLSAEDQVVLTMVEAFVEGAAIRSEVLSCQDNQAPLYHGDGWMASSLRRSLPALDNPQYAVQGTVGVTATFAAINSRDRIKAHRAEQALQVLFLRDIFGNPFRPITFSPEWRTDTAVSLASQMYESRDFSAMPILADALQDAGCDSDDILSHCRGGGPHVRGCWVVDLVLGKN